MAVLMAGVPPHERPRGRLFARGAEALGERELLALILRSGAQGLSALDLAAELLAEYGGLRGLAAARPEALETRRGVGSAKAAALVAAFTSLAGSIARWMVRRSYAARPTWREPFGPSSTRDESVCSSSSATLPTDSGVPWSFTPATTHHAPSSQRVEGPASASEGPGGRGASDGPRWPPGDRRRSASLRAC